MNSKLRFVIFPNLGVIFGLAAFPDFPQKLFYPPPSEHGSGQNIWTSEYSRKYSGNPSLILKDFSWFFSSGKFAMTQKHIKQHIVI